jgi:hypothetical protein
LVAYFLDLQDGRANRYEIIPALILFYPQWCVLKYLGNYLFHQNEKQLINEKKHHEKHIETAEPFLEAGLQVGKFLCF